MADVRLTATNPQDSSVVPVACNSKGELLLEQPPEAPEFDGSLDGDLTVSGGATFASEVRVENSDDTYGIVINKTDNSAKGIYIVSGSITSNEKLICCFSAFGGAAADRFVVKADGSAEFADGKAGFTKEGYLWCTTRRGDRVMLDATSNGLGSWVDYPQTQTQDL